MKNESLSSLPARPRVRAPSSSGLIIFARVSETGRARASAALLCLSFVFCLAALSDVVCTWDGTGYTCSGSGGIIQVGGGGGVMPGPDSGIVTTNGFGVCTNCSQITPAELQQLADAVDGSATFVGTLCDQILVECGDLRDSITSNNNEIATYRDFGINTAISNRIEVTNYMYTVNNNQTAAMRYCWDKATLSGNNRGAAAESAAASVYYYANNFVKPQNDANLQKLSEIERDVGSVQGAVTYLRSPVAEDLAAGAVACEFALSSGGGGGTNSTPSVSTGNWCTYDQGEALKSLLDELKQYAKKQHAQLVAISNYTQQTVNWIRAGLFTEYTAIPSASGLGDSWQQVYLDGAETPWGYAPTNILARIELLLYGLSGVGTNDNPFASDETSTSEMSDSYDDAMQDVQSTLNITTDLDTRPYQTLGNSLIRFFRAFEMSNTQLYADTQLIGEITVSGQTRDGSQSVVVPAIRVGAESVPVFNSFQGISHAVFTVIYAFGYGVLVFMFWRGYSLLAVKFFRWIVQIIQSFLT